jgi:hypothetical protein
MSNSSLVGLMLLAIPIFCNANSYRQSGAPESKDFANGVSIWKPLAEKGDAVAQYNLGVIYDVGINVRQNDEKAVKWFRLAAAQGLAKAQYNLGVMYFNGEFVYQDNIDALMWFHIADLNGHSIAKESKAIISKYMPPKDISKAQNLARECIKKNYMDC